MKKIIFIIPVALMIGCGGAEEESQEEPSVYEQIDDILEENQKPKEFVPKDHPAKGTNKAAVIGIWSPSNSTVRIEVTKDRYYTFDGEQKIWDYDWEMTTAEEYSPSTIDDNGTYLHVFNDEGESFYYILLEDVQEDLYTGYVGGTGDVVTYERLHDNGPQ